MDDMRKRGRQALGKRLNHKPQDGENNNSAKVTKEQVREARKLYDRGFSQAEIGRRTGIDRRNVWPIVHNKTWINV